MDRGGCGPWDRKESDATERLTVHTLTHIRNKEVFITKYYFLKVLLILILINSSEGFSHLECQFSPTGQDFDFNLIFHLAFQFDDPNWLLPGPINIPFGIASIVDRLRQHTHCTWKFTKCFFPLYINFFFFSSAWFAGSIIVCQLTRRSSWGWHPGWSNPSHWHLLTACSLVDSLRTLLSLPINVL